jgi:outer membrane immunogenic protein
MKSMMIRTGFAAAALLLAPLAALAADLPYKAHPVYVPEPAYANWTGFYIGLNAGYGFGKSDLTDTNGVDSGSFNLKGALAGATAGYNFQTGTWVWGAEGDLDASWIKGTTSTVCITSCEVKNSWLGTARARLGYAGWNNWLPYITAGAAFGSVKVTDDFGSATVTKVGWTAGLGIEYAFMNNWSAKAEYLYADLGKATCSAPDCGFVDVSGTFKANLVRFGVNYRF